MYVAIHRNVNMPDHLDDPHKPANASGSKTAPTEQLAQAPDRRRPGRLHDVNAALIPLLRNPTPGRRAGIDAYDDLEARRREDLAPGQGIMVAVLISGLFWAALFFALR
jgi:hypothetical protein